MHSHKYQIIANNFELVDQYPILKDCKRIAKEDMNLLGAPIFEGKAVNTALQAKINDLERSVERLSLLQAHDALCLLKNALTMPKLQYIHRTSPCADNLLLYALYDFLCRGLSKILTVDLNDSQWT